MSRTLQCFSLLLLLVLMLAGVVCAAPPDAGSLLNQQRQPGTSLPERLPKPDEKAVERPPLTETGVKVLVKEFRFSGLDGLATEAELQSLVADAIGKTLGFGELQGLAARVTSYLREKKGYLLAKAYLPKQDVTEGVIEIAILAGRIDGGVKVNVKPPSRISQSLLEGIADRAVPAGSPARMEQMERAVLLMSDLPGIDAYASLEPGTTPGTTRMIIDATEEPLLSGAIIGDNFGDRYTGEWRATGLVAANDPFGWGDRLQLSVTGAEHLVEGSIAYALPLGATGANAALNYTGLSYELGKDLADLDAEGEAHTVGVKINYPLMRTRAASLWGGLGFEYQMLTDEAGGVTIRDRDIPVGNVSVTGSFYDTFNGGGLTSATVTAYQGELDLSHKGGAKLADAAGPEAAGSFFRSTYSLARLQRLTQGLSFLAAVRGQLAADNLDSSQKFILGGPTGVRAYPVSEGSGDEGHLFSAEARFELPFMPTWATTQLIGFYDAGWVKLHHDRWPGAVTNATGSNDYWLSGAGVGLNVGKADLYSIRTSYAHAIDDNDGRSINGENADGRSDHHRFWLQAVVWF